MNRDYITQKLVILGPFGEQMLEFRGKFYPGLPGVFSGPPDRWCPPDGAEISIVECYLIRADEKLIPLADFCDDLPSEFIVELMEQVEAEYDSPPGEAYLSEERNFD